MNIVICNEVIVVETLEIGPLISPAAGLIERLSVDKLYLAGRSMGRSSGDVVDLNDLTLLNGEGDKRFAVLSPVKVESNLIELVETCRE